MVIRQFPPVEDADDNGLLAVGGDLEIDSLLCAYRSGIFPWPLLGEDLLTWFAPPSRALLFLDRFHVSRSLKRRRNTSNYEIVFDRNCAAVIDACADAARRGMRGTWITPDMRGAYTELHRAGYCHSVECYRGGQLVGGLYGVAIRGMFAGESMFFRESDASKLCLWRLVEHLKERGAQWIDCQQMTPFFRGCGAVEVPRPEFMTLLREALQRDVELF